MGEYVKDLVERIVRTFLAAASTVLLADGTNLLDVSVWEGAAVAGYTAVVTLIMGLLSLVNGSEDASFRKRL